MITKKRNKEKKTSAVGSESVSLLTEVNHPSAIIAAKLKNWLMLPLPWELGQWFLPEWPFHRCYLFFWFLTMACNTNKKALLNLHNVVWICGVVTGNYYRGMLSIVQAE